MWSVYVEAACIIGIMVVLASASVSDLRTRTVCDRHWMVAGAFAVVCSSVMWCMVSPILLVLNMVGSSLLLVYMLSERLSGPYSLIPLVPSAVCFLAMYQGGAGAGALVTPVMFVVLLLMYHLGLIRGGADAKALMVIAIAFPMYPILGPIPLVWGPIDGPSLVINPTFSILVVSLLLSLVPSAFIAVRNLSSGYRGRGMFSSYPMPIQSAREAHVWPVEDIVDGSVARCRIPDDPSEVYDRLQASGRDSVRVTPMVPFVVPITVAAASVLLLGNPLFMLF